MRYLKSYSDMGMQSTIVLNELTRLYHHAITFLRDFLAACTESESLCSTQQVKHGPKAIQLSMRKQKELASAFFNQPKRFVSLLRVTQCFRLLVE